MKPTDARATAAPPLPEPTDFRRSRRRLTALMIGAVLSVVLLALVAGDLTRKRTINDEFMRLSAHIQRGHDQDIQLTLALYQARARNLLAAPGVIDAVRAGDRARLLDRMVGEYAQLRDENPHFDVLHFHGPDNVTLLRAHRPELHGDDLSAVRPMIAEANRVRRTLSGFEIGKNGISYRVTAPIFAKGDFLGTLELGVDIQHFSKRTARIFGVETGVVFLREEMRAYLDQHGDAGFTRQGDYLLPRATPPAIVEAFASADGDAAPYTMLGGGADTHVLYRNLVIGNYLGEKVGLLLVLDDVGDRIARIQHYAIGTTLGTLLLLAFLAWAFNRSLGRAQHALALGRARLDLAMAGAEEGFWDLDLVNRAIYFSPRAQAIIGDADGEGPQTLDAWEASIDPADRERARDALRRHLAGESPQYVVEYRARHRDGHEVWIHSRGQAVRDGDGRPTRMLGMLSDFSERKRMEEQIRHMAQHDPLTGVANRALFSDLLQQALVNARRDHTRFAVMTLDLDDFKPVNDRHGHHVGDLLLQEIARRMQECVRESDIVARIGGDEFIVLLRGIEQDADALAVAEKVRQALRQPIEVAGKVLGVSASIGIALYPEHGDDEIELFRNADCAMYAAKRHGHDTVRVYRPEDRADAG